jgi:acyl transferase domain-containing protein
MASLIKAVKALEHRHTGHSPGEINRELPTDHALILQNRSTLAKRRRSRRVALNSYAIGSVNAHIVLEECADKELPRSLYSRRLTRRKFRPCRLRR